MPQRQGYAHDHQQRELACELTRPYRQLQGLPIVVILAKPVLVTTSCDHRLSEKTYKLIAGNRLETGPTACVLMLIKTLM